jgi:para-nitrobenzyl esterase
MISYGKLGAGGFHMFERLVKMHSTILLAAIWLTPFIHAAISTQAKTDKGTVEGDYTADHKVIAFKGIPFAAPPVGDLRWKPPVPAAAWNGVRAAKDFGYRCPQSAIYNDMVFHDRGASEDCLNLNVWAPVDAKPGSLPVMVWIYGGGYVTGGTSEYRQNGEVLAHRNVVVVSMNYRLGIFGFMVHPELTAESPHHASGNYGLMDIAAALEWVKHNIAAFGGDPKNVTIFGESAGSFAVSTIMASPLSKRLINKAIGESGGALYSSGLNYQSLSEREQRDSSFMQTTFGITKLAELRHISTDDLVRAVSAKTTPPPPRFGPDVDGYFLPDTIPHIYAAGQQAHVPLIAGWNADEGRDRAINANPKTSAATFIAQAEKDFPGRSREFLSLYPVGSDDEAFNSAADFAGDKFIAYSTWRWLEAHVATGKSPVYHYFFTLGSPGDKNHSANMGAFHSDEIEYVFGVLDSRPQAVWRPEDRKLSDQMMEYWTNFARSGDPNGPGLPKWPVYAASEWITMNLNANSQAKPDARRARYLFLDTIWGKDKKSSD